MRLAPGFTVTVEGEAGGWHASGAASADEAITRIRAYRRQRLNMGLARATARGDQDTAARCRAALATAGTVTMRAERQE